ncbi:Kinesin-like protein KIN-14P [Orobanche hederae]
MHFTLNAERYNGGTDGSSRWKLLGERIRSADSAPREEPFQMLSSPPFGEERRRTDQPSAALTTHAGDKFHEVFQLKQGSYTDLPAAKISEMMKSNSLDNAPTQSLLSVVNGILDESIELKNGEIPHEIERRICTQAEHLRTQNNLFRAREEKYQSRIKVLKALGNLT